MNPWWMLLYVIVGGLVGFIGVIVGGGITYFINWKLEKNKREQLAKDFKEGVLSELRDALPRIVSYHYTSNLNLKTLNEKNLNWELKTLEEFEDIDTGMKEEIKGAKKLFKVGKLNGTIGKGREPLVSLNLSILNESITSFSLLDSNIRGKIFRIKKNIYTLNTAIELSTVTYNKLLEANLPIETLDIIEKYMNMYAYQIGKLSYETAELIKDLILE